MLTHHHESEDRLVWPALVAADPSLAVPLAALSDEHEELERLLEELATARVVDDRDKRLADAAIAVRDAVHRHLDHEEPILFPALRTIVSDTEWGALSQQIIEDAPTAGQNVPLMLALFDLVGTPEEISVIVDKLPPPAREAVPALRRDGHVLLVELGAPSR
jgi:iron-sulfur cluster repair protein YtfE (RIC family)